MRNAHWGFVGASGVVNPLGEYIAGPLLDSDGHNDRVLPFFEDHEIPVLRILTDRGTEFCEPPDKHPYELYLQLNEIEHTKTKANSFQTNGICEGVH